MNEKERSDDPMICNKQKPKLWFLLVIVLSCLFLASCKEEEHMSATVEENPLSEQGIIDAVKDYVFQNFGDEVEVEILNTRDLTHTTYIGPGIDGPSIFDRRFVRVQNGHAYQVNIFNAKYAISVEGVFNDGFTLYDEETGEVSHFDREITLDHRYQTMKDEVDLEVEFNDILGEYFTKFHFYKDVTNYSHGVGRYNIYLYSTDDIKMVEAFERLVELSYRKYPCIYEFRAFIFTNEKLYDSVDFDKCNNVEFIKTGESEEGKTGMLTELDLEYDPQLLLERYWGISLTLVEICHGLDHEFFVSRGTSEIGQKRYPNSRVTKEDVDAFSEVVFIYKVYPEMYKNSLEKSKSESQCGLTYAYVFNLP